jgi:hypothetical protein
MKKRRVGEYAIEMRLRQIELEEILVPYFAAAMGARHGHEVRGAFQTYRDMAKFAEHLEVATGPAAKIEYREWRLTSDGLQQRLDVLGDIVITCASPKLFRVPVVMVQGLTSDLFEVVRIKFHSVRVVLMHRREFSTKRGAPLYAVAAAN